jgi:hypothetical protein
MTFSQMEHLVKFEIEDTFNQNCQWSFNQVRHLAKMANVIIVKWAILPTYLPCFTTYLPTY